MKTSILMKLRLPDGRFAKFFAPRAYSDLVSTVKKLLATESRLRLWYIDESDDEVLLSEEMYDLAWTAWPWLEMRLNVDMESKSMHHWLLAAESKLRALRRKISSYRIKPQVTQALQQFADSSAKRLCYVRDHLIRYIQTVVKAAKTHAAAYKLKITGVVNRLRSRSQQLQVTFNGRFSAAREKSVNIYRSLSARGKVRFDSAKSVVQASKRKCASVCVLVVSLAVLALTAGSLRNFQSQGTLAKSARQLVSSATFELCQRVPACTAPIPADYLQWWDSGRLYFTEGWSEGRGIMFDPEADSIAVGGFFFRELSEGFLILKNEVRSGLFTHKTLKKGRVIDLLQHTVTDGRSPLGQKGLGVKAKYEEMTNVEDFLSEALEWKAHRMEWFYRGELSGGDFNGTGTLQTPDFTYSGQFDHGDITGRGRLTRNDGEDLYGEFVNGELHGFGCIVRTDGVSLCGEFSRGKCQGKAVRQSREGTKHVKCQNGKDEESWWW